MLKLLEFDYLIENKKGCENSVADALSRKFQDMYKEDVADNKALMDNCKAITMTVPTWLTEVSDSYIGDATCTRLLQELALDPHSSINYSLQFVSSTTRIGFTLVQPLI
jgi:hypothetical protein